MDLAGIFNNAYIKIATIEKAVAGFSSTGICPLNPDKTAEDFEAAQQYMPVITDEENLKSRSWSINVKNASFSDI